MFDTTFWAALLGIIWIDLLLSGDNAVVIALISRHLPPHQQKWGIIGGATAAILLRIVMSFCIAFLMMVPFLSAIGGAFLLYIAAKMLIDAGDDDSAVEVKTTLLAAVGAIALADASMSLDNVMAIAALSHSNVILMSLGILLSIPLVIAGSAIISLVIDRFPILTWAGAALLGWVAGGIIYSDPFLAGGAQHYLDGINHYAMSIVGACLVLTVGLANRLRRADIVA